MRSLVPREFSFRVLLYLEEDEWIAHALEMDLVGTGENSDEATEMLKDAVDAQLSFCIQHHISPFKLAPKRYLNAWEKSQEMNLNSILDTEGFCANTDQFASILRFDSSDRRRMHKRVGFQPA
jgi:hypothetical protein